MHIRFFYWRIADIAIFPLALVATIGAIENSYAYGAIGALINGQAIAAYAACEEN